MKNKKDPLDKLFVNCNRLGEGKAKRILSSKRYKDLSIRNWKWDIPLDLQQISSADCYQYETFIGLGKWNNNDEKERTKFILIAKEGKLIYLEPEIVKIMYNSIKEDNQGVKK